MGSDARGKLESGLFASHVALALMSAYQTAELDAFFGGVFSTWWTKGFLLLPAMISIPMCVSWLRRRTVVPYLLAGTAYWVFASSGYILTLMEEGELVSGHVTGVAGAAVATVSLLYLGLRIARRTARPTG